MVIDGPLDLGDVVLQIGQMDLDRVLHLGRSDVQPVALHLQHLLQILAPAHQRFELLERRWIRVPTA
ncbi:hypothetical protein NB709_004120 [Xanthomonas sacchari]|nr:hypothetical protein [Xanthomonas sacchari]